MAIGKAGGFHRISFKSNNLEILLLTQVKGRGYYQGAGVLPRGGGITLEYRFNTIASLTAGRFYNSDRAYSNYAGVYYQPIAIGPIKVGAVIGGFNGYPNTNNGGWFAAALPALTWEGDWVGANVFLIPTIGDRVHGAISLQVKLKVFEKN
ncbi:hypothetical protein [Polynucleobacter sp. AM-25C3]|uniref:hypothetical protein n=1 Tax=Polynucleobacter sp. AM-25C3 TaxID=1855569 RepID=UPI002107648C|nr:hypothetical protein [Polynucleobacter sp. AM-25C3]